MANRLVKKAVSGKTLGEVKALIDGLPEGLDLENRLAIFKETFSVSKRGFREHGGPTDDTLNNAIKGNNWPNESTLENLCQAATTALVKKYPGLARKDASPAGKWLSNGPILIAQSPPRSGSEPPNHLESTQLAMDRLDQAREAFKRSSEPGEPWRLMEQSIRGLKDDFETVGGYAPENVPEVDCVSTLLGLEHLDALIAALEIRRDQLRMHLVEPIENINRGDT